MYERKKSPLASRRSFAMRMARHILASIGLSLITLAIGMLGYHLLEEMSWVDAFVNAAMIVTGMGPTTPLHTDAGKIFAGVYAIFAFVVYVGNMGIILAPVTHRILHSFHLDERS